MAEENPIIDFKIMTKIFSVGLMIFLLCSCSKDKTPGTETREPILMADREAPLGWVYLRIYADSTFEFESRGLERSGTIYPGTIELISPIFAFFTRLLLYECFCMLVEPLQASC